MDRFLLHHFVLPRVPLSPVVYPVLPLKGWQLIRVLPGISFCYSLKDLLAQLSASISSLVVSLYSEFMTTFVPPLQCWRTRFSPL